MSLLEDTGKRDFRRDRDTDQYYNYFKTKLGLDFKDTFLLSYKYALFKGHTPKKLDKKPIHIGQISLIDDKEIELMVIALFVDENDEDILSKGSNLLNTIEEYANVGVRLLYDRFVNSDKSEILMLEEIKNEIKQKLDELK
tara:strand:+ start:1083 stop:1505 length:423 start_codon:yes stop_codon:yes gene_type:complete